MQRVPSSSGTESFGESSEQRRCFSVMQMNLEDTTTYWIWRSKKLLKRRDVQFDEDQFSFAREFALKNQDLARVQLKVPEG